MLKTISAWKELGKLRGSSKKFKDTNKWIRNNIIRVLEKEGWNDFFMIPRTVDEIMDHFSYTDKDFLTTIIDALVSDKTLKKLKDETYQMNTPIVSNGIKVPSLFEESVVEIFTEQANFIPNRLNGKFHEFTGSFNLFSWDDWLANLAYEVFRKAAFAFTPEALNNPGKFLDGGCGIGMGTAAIWLYNYERGHIHPNTGLKLYGIDNGEDFIKIAKEEFHITAARHKKLSKEEMKEYKEYYPEFKVGSVSKIPYEDDFFDYVFTSQVLHWTNSPKTIKEIARVLRQGGIFFGSNVMIPNVDPYMSVQIKVAEGAIGAFTKQEMTTWLKDAGFSKIKYATPMGIFRAEKV